MASLEVRRRTDGSHSYRALFRIDGQQCTETFDAEKDARHFIRMVERLGGAKARELVRTPSTRAKAAPALEEMLAHHLAHATGITAGTRAGYAQLAQRTWLASLGAIPVDLLTRDDVAAWVGRQAAATTSRGTATSAKTVANGHGLLSSVMATAVEGGHCAANPCRGVRLPRGVHEEMTFLTPAEYVALREQLPAAWRGMVDVIAGTGMRWGEVTALAWGEVDLIGAPPSVRVVRAYKRGPTGVRYLGEPKTARSRRTISLGAQAAAALAAHREADVAPGDLVFTGRAGTQVHHQSWHPRVWTPAVDRFAAAYGKRPRVHDLRHSHVAWLIAAGVPLPMIQRRLGHESITTTVDRYGHVDPAHGAVVAELLTAALDGVAAPAPSAVGPPR